MCIYIRDKVWWYLQRAKEPTRVVLGKDDVENKQREKGWPDA